MEVYNVCFFGEVHKDNRPQHCVQCTRTTDHSTVFSAQGQQTTALSPVPKESQQTTALSPVHKESQQTTALSPVPKESQQTTALSPVHKDNRPQH
ncbi:hypothetical protein ACOMHN_048562 [Nucella lapillus]